MNSHGSGPSRRGNDPTTTSNAGDIASSFGSFFEEWLVRQEHYLDEVRSAAENHGVAQQGYLEDLVDRVLSHYQQYYDEKSRVAERDPSVLFSPPWLSRLERSLLWVAGFKPGLVIELAMGSLAGELTEDQVRRMEGLRARTRMKERELDDGLAQLHEVVACPPILEAARRCQRPPRDGEVEDGMVAASALRARMEVVVGNADLLRRRTALGAMEILNPGQRVKFLATAAEFLQKTRSWGMQRDAERRGR